MHSLGVAVDVTTGLVAATNVDMHHHGIGNVTLYAPGSATPCATVTDRRLSLVYQAAFDRAGDLYVTAYAHANAPVIGVIRGGCSAKGVILLSTPNTFGSYLFGIQITPFGKIAVEAPGTQTIYTYDPPVRGVFGEPIATTVLTGSQVPQQFAFTAKGAFLSVADTKLNKVLKYAYAAGGAPVASFRTRQIYPTGLVIAPPAQP
jgi:hypothetical protein